MKTRMQCKTKFLFICILLLLSACRTTKESTTGSLAGLGSSEVFRSMLGRAVQYETLSGKLNVHFKTPKKSISSNAALKIIKDRKIQLSIQAFLGIEAFRVDLSPDSIVVVDRINKLYVAERLDELNKKEGLPLDFNFSNLQALLSNRLFLAGKDDLSADDRDAFSIEIADDKAVLKTKDRQGVQYLFTGNPEFYITSLRMSAQKEAKTVTLSSEYDNFQAVSAVYRFPMSLEIKLKTPAKEDYRMEFKYSKIEWDKKINPELTIPQKYQRVRFDEALKIIQKIG